MREEENVPSSGFSILLYALIFEPDILSFMIPMSRFKEMYDTMRSSCLFDTCLGKNQGKNEVINDLIITVHLLLSGK